MEKVDKNLQEAQFLEQNLHNLILQKQAFQMELAETQAALKEIEKSGEDVFKIVGQLMLKKEKSKIKKELTDKEKIIESRTKALEKQEAALLKQLENSGKETTRQEKK